MGDNQRKGYTDNIGPRGVRIERFRKKVCSKLAKLYDGKDPCAPCCNCAWFAYWADGVLRSADDAQVFYFAYHEIPLYPGQEQFFCKSDGQSYYVGKAQKVELEWMQDDMMFRVKPINQTVFRTLLPEGLMRRKADLVEKLRALQTEFLLEATRETKDKETAVSCGCFAIFSHPLRWCRAAR